MVGLGCSRGSSQQSGCYVILFSPHLFLPQKYLRFFFFYFLLYLLMVYPLSHWRFLFSTLATYISLSMFNPSFLSFFFFLLFFFLLLFNTNHHHHLFSFLFYFYPIGHSFFFCQYPSFPSCHNPLSAPFFPFLIFSLFSFLLFLFLLS